jgi:hypothetical protein
MPAAGAYTLTLAVYAAGQPAHPGGDSDGQEIARQAVGLPPGATIRLSLRLPPGEHLLTLAALQPAVQPPGDQRRLSLGYQAVRLERRP